MSHEIRTPLNAIVGYSQLLQRDPAMRDAQRERVGIIQRAGDHLLALINDVLEISKIEAGHRTVQVGEVEITQLLRDLETMFQLRAHTRKLKLTVHVGKDVPLYIAGDATRLRQVLVNLIGNAVKFTVAGSVTVRADRVAGASGAHDLVVEVEDTGPGIEPDTLRQLFKPFSQGRAGVEAQGGTGLGLAISREYARMMGGDITVTSRVGAGSLFRFSCPCREIEAKPAMPIAPVGKIVGVVDAGTPWRVLIVDDDEDSRGWLCALLAEVGFAVREAANGLEGLGLVASWRPHVVLMDVNMPVMNGYDAMRSIRAMARDEQPSIIALTASAFDDQQAEIRAAGADVVLRKPCRARDVFRELERQLGLTYTRAAPIAEEAPSTSSTVAAPPADAVVALCEAAHVADYERLLELIDRLPAEHAGMASSLRELLGRYAYDEIQARLRE
jgi:CheY-like chemotaxis protein